MDGHPSEAKLSQFLDGNRLLIASTFNEYSLQQMMQRVLADGSVR